ncbi:MAG: DUF433 domain-containing protein [Desulfobacterales bacterium]|jgi:uncharacterized protein (DUF433 family)|nr:MAG: DUF433 domain-containing protein [Desulfobacterales bacterium]
MSSVQKSIRLPEEAVKEIETLASNTGKDFSGLARDLLIEAVKMRRCPGITFAEGSAGRRARIAGTGIDVWELIATFKGLGESYEEIKKAYHWLSEQQLRSALSYYALYPKEIDERITRNEEITQEKIVKRFPFLARPAERK